MQYISVFKFYALPFWYSQCETPKRKKALPLLKIPSFASDASSDAG